VSVLGCLCGCCCCPADIFFDLDKKKWRVLYHEITGKPNACKTCGQPMPGITKHCGGYAESVTPDIWGDWVVSPPQLGAYTLDIDFAGFRPNATTAEADDDAAPPPDHTATAGSWLPPAAPVAGRVHDAMPATSAPPPPFRLGKSYAIYANESLTAWGGNAVLGDDGHYHLYTSAMAGGKNNNRHLSDLTPGPCVINTWERNSLVLHAVASTPLGPFVARDVALPSSHTNPQVMRTPDGEWLLYSGACCSLDQYNVSHGCKGCHKGQCGPEPCSKPSPLPPLPAGNVSLWRRERPKMLFDRNGRPTHLFVRCIHAYHFRSCSQPATCHSLSVTPHLYTMVAIAVTIACFRTRPILETWLATRAGRRADRSRWSPRFCNRRVAATLLLLPRLPILCCQAVVMETQQKGAQCKRVECCVHSVVKLQEDLVLLSPRLSYVPA
jgi:hypothetical protein